MVLAAQWSLVVLAIAGTVVASSMVVALVRLLPVLERADTVLRRARITLVRLNRMTADLEEVAHDARQVERRVAGLAGVLLDNLEGPVRILSALASATKTGVASWLGASEREGRGARNGHRPARAGGTPHPVTGEGGMAHE